MEEQEFLGLISQRLGRPRPAAAPARAILGVPDFHRGPQPAPAEMAERFKAELERVGGKAYLEASPAAASARARELVEAWNPSRVITWARNEFAGWDLEWLWSRPGCLSWDAPPAPGAATKRLFMEADLGVTAAGWAVAETGSLLLPCAPGRPRSASLTPPAHLALLDSKRLVSRLGPAYAAAEQEGLPSSLNLITGPSRTSDIENDATIGVHGPASLTVIIRL